nr:hypothetical protein [Phascolarctobacterium succinatutens]
MKYSYKFKRQCVELYRQGKCPETPKDIPERNFHNTIRIWARIEDKCGPEALQHKNYSKIWSPDALYPNDWKMRNYLSLGGVGAKALEWFLSERKDMETV